LIRWRYYQSLLPNSFYAKVSVGGPSAQIERGWEHVSQFVGVHLGWLILLPALFALLVVTVRYLRFRRDAGRERAAQTQPNSDDTLPSGDPRRAFLGLTYFAALVLAYGAYIVYVGGDWSVGRVFFAIQPFWYFVSAAAVRSTPFALPSAARLTALLAIPLALALWFASSFNGEFRIFIGGFDAARATAARIAAGKWLKQNVPAGTWIAVDAAGQIPYFSELPTIDMFGINDLHIGRMPVATLGEGTPGHEKFDLGYIIARAPQYVIIYGTLFDSVAEYRRAPVAWTDNPDLARFLTIYERNDK
jgi:hypothetical protein